MHGKHKTLGYRIGDFAYSTDTNELPETAFEALRGVKVWVVDCLRYTPSPVHANLEKTLQWLGTRKSRKQADPDAYGARARLRRFSS
jgi:phosphoribosyl 1,2-cyclic phosphate phosphodiesterase